jgi:hypothetical protein
LGRTPFSVDRYTEDWKTWVEAGRNPKGQPKTADYVSGPMEAPSDEEIGLKDTVKAFPGYITRVVGTPPIGMRIKRDGEE